MRRLLCGDADSGGPALVVRDSSICVRKTRMVFHTLSRTVRLSHPTQLRVGWDKRPIQ